MIKFSEGLKELEIDEDIGAFEDDALSEEDAMEALEEPIDLIDLGDSNGG